MAESDFELRLDRMFNEPPVFPDAEAFARLVEMRLDRGWGLRQIGIGSAGLAGGLIGAYQLMGSRFLEQASQLADRDAFDVTGGLSHVLRAGEAMSALPFGGEALWMAAALGVVALAFAVTRAVEEFQ